MITLRAIAKAYGSHQVLRGIDAEVSPGHIVAIMGGSGSGKSTLLRCLNGLETFDAGSIEIADFLLRAGDHDADLLQRLRCAVGMVFQEFHLFPHLSVLENITLAPRIVRRRAREETENHALQLLEAVGLRERASAYPRQLSGGQKQRVAIARALAQGSRVLLLDEPTSALDPELRGEVRQVLHRVARGVHGESKILPEQSGEALTMVLVTHELRLATDLADELWILDEGTIIERGPPREVIAKPMTEAGRDFIAHCQR